MGFYKMGLAIFWDKMNVQGEMRSVQSEIIFLPLHILMRSVQGEMDYFRVKMNVQDEMGFYKMDLAIFWD